MEESEKSIDFDVDVQPNNSEEELASIHKNERIQNTFLFVGGFLLAMIIILILFTLKWRQNSGDFYPADSIAPDNYDYAEGTAMPDELSEDDMAEYLEGDISESDEVMPVREAEPVSGLYAAEDDVIFFLGGPFKDLQQRYASSEQILGAESHYFMDEYLAVVYDDVTKEILCLESDGPGKMPIKLAGMQIGMTRQELFALMDESGIGYELSEEDSVVKFNWHANETVKYKAEVRFEDDEVIDIICRIR